MGAGMMPTASAVLSDVLQIAKDLSLGNTHSSPPRFYGGKKTFPLIKMSDTLNKYYLRFQAEDRPGVLGKITGSLGKQGISIESVIQKGRHLGGGDVPVVIMTHDARERNIISALKEIDRFSTIKAKTNFIRIEDL
jgi:homoserine dehydrogenase